MSDPVEDYAIGIRDNIEACWGCGEIHTGSQCPPMECPQCGELGWNQYDGSCPSCHEVAECGECGAVYPLVEGTFIPGIPAVTGGPPDGWDPGSPDEFECPACGSEVTS